MSSARPDPGDIDDDIEFRRWYWTVAELRDIARRLEVPASGTKDELSDRIAARLSGREPPPQRRTPRARVPEPLSDDSVIPPGMVLDRRLRDWFTIRIGPGFRSDHHLRTFLQESAGATLGDAVNHWHATRGAPAPPIGGQFEYNRFVRQWRAEHPGASHADVTAAWRVHRSLPAEDRAPTRDRSGEACS